ncbi:MAG: DUF2029 domain-containing protein [Rhizobiales bacterium]|nr:DUF2029 domain-containing protein [Hyphomicrobiales bacterium]
MGRKAGLAVLIAWTLAMAIWAYAAGAQHDYVYYLAQWRLALEGADAWSTDNAYGPLHTSLALLLPLGTLAPKALIVGSLLAANAALAIRLMSVRPTAAVGLHYGMVILANIAVASLGVVYGLNDALVASLIVAAVLLRLRGALVLAGLMLGLVALLKYYPLLLVPFFALEGRRFRPSLILTALATIGAGFIACHFVFGDGWMAAILFGAGREPKLLSVLAAFSAATPVVGGSELLDWLVRHNAAFVLATAVACLAVAWWRRIHWLEASVLALLAVLLVYKVGHQQFFLPWLFLVAALPLAGTASADRLAGLCWPFALFLSLYQWGYAFGTDQYHATGGAVRLYAGFVAFPLGVATIAGYFYVARRPAPGASLQAPA